MCFATCRFCGRTEHADHFTECDHQDHITEYAGQEYPTPALDLDAKEDDGQA